MTRRCSHCSHNGHNSRTCPNRGVKLFGVRLTDGSIRKSASMGNLTHCAGSAHQNTAPGSPGETPEHAAAADGYASEDFLPGPESSSRERKKGTPWTEEEHRVFLLGLQKLGKGDWRGISRNYVLSRTPTQVASHAQKYFIRQANVSKKKRRSSLFDIVADEPVDATVLSQDLLSTNLPLPEAEESNPQLITPSVLDEDCESMKSSDSNEGDPTLPKPDNSSGPYPVILPAYISPFFPFSPPLWSGYGHESTNMETHEVLKPTATHSKSLINVDELVGMSKLSLGDSLGNTGSSLSLKLQEGTARQSAFHANPASTGSSNSPIHAV